MHIQEKPRGGNAVAALVDEDIPAVMEGDPACLRQVLVNLIGMSLSSPFT
jgi:signal transduction histidine kinase